MARIGGTFDEELRAAGVPLDGVAWGADGAVVYASDVPQAVRGQVERVLAAHAADAPDPWAYREQRRAAYAAELGQRPGEMEAVGDVLDALLRHVRARDGDANLHAELAEIARRVDAVKARFPKP